VTEDEKLAHSLKIKFGLARNEPTLNQLSRIKRDIQLIQNAGGTPTYSDWEYAVLEHCNSAGTCSYSGIDNSDLNTLLRIAIANSRNKA